MVARTMKASKDISDEFVIVSDLINHSPKTSKARINDRFLIFEDKFDAVFLQLREERF